MGQGYYGLLLFGMEIHNADFDKVLEHYRNTVLKPKSRTFNRESVTE